jgi:hypothetical protein
VTRRSARCWSGYARSETPVLDAYAAVVAFGLHVDGDHRCADRRDPAGLGGWRWRPARLEDQNAALRDEQQRLEAEREQLQTENERLRAERERLQAANERLRAGVDALRRAAKRQAAPFSKDDLTPTPQRPGRKPGAAYGTRAHRYPPEHVDRVIMVGLPAVVRELS